MNATRTIAGHEVTLESGKRYVASLRTTQRNHCYVRIEMDNGNAAAFLPANFETASLFIAEFNDSNGGRVW